MKVSLFVTCLVDQFCPEVALGVVNVLDRLGISCDVPAGQTCCGQPAFNSGCAREARDVAAQFLRAFAGAEIIVTPSGSCADMAKRHIPSLFPDGTPERAAADAIGARVFEFSQFLVHVLRVDDLGVEFPHRVTYHDSCHLLRGMGVRDEPRTLIRYLRGAEMVEMQASDSCCGFGGTFAVKYPDISAAMGGTKLANIAATEAEFLIACDTGCLMHLRGLLSRAGNTLRAVHLAQVLGGTVEGVGRAR